MFLTLSQDTNQPISPRVLEATGALAVIPQTDHDKVHTQEKKASNRLLNVQIPSSLS